jgi:hypothetical protein
MNISVTYFCNSPILVAEQSKAWICNRGIAGIAGSNPGGGLNVCPLWSSFVVRVEVSATFRSLVQGSPTNCMCFVVWSIATTPTVRRWKKLN